MITLYGIPNCDTIKKTRRWLESHDAEYQFHDYRKDGCTPALIKQFLAHFDYEQLINTRGTTWRKLPESTRNQLNTAAAVKLMTSHPALIKRPLLTNNNVWLLGYDEAGLTKLLANN